MTGSVGSIFMLMVVVLSIFWVLYSAGKYTGYNIQSLFERSTYTKPLMPVIDWLQNMSAKQITTEIGLLALGLIFILVMVAKI